VCAGAALVLMRHWCTTRLHQGQKRFTHLLA